MTVKDRQLRISRFIRETLQPAKIRSRELIIISVVVFAVAVGVRLLHWQNNWLTIDNTMNKTAAGYKQEAQFLTHGDFKAFIRGHYAEPDPAILTHPPGYPIFIAAVHALTRQSSVALRLVHIAFGAVATVLVLLIAAEFLPTGVAVITGLLAAMSPQLSYYSLVLLPDAVIAVPLLIGIYLFLRARKRPNGWMIVGAGICIGISCWLRANVMLLAPFLCLVIPFLFPRNKRVRYMVLLVTASVLTIAPITIRNVIVFKSFIPLALGTGITLMEGIADYDPGRQFGMEQYDHEVSRQEAVLYQRPDYAEDIYRPDGIQRERLRVGRALSVISANKVWFAGVLAKRAGKMLTYEPVPIVSTEPTITNSPNTTQADLVWRGSPVELIAKTDPRVRLSPNDQTLLIMADDPWSAVLLATVKVQPQSDYLLTVPTRAVEGRMVINIARLDNGKTLASATVPDSLDPAAPKVGELTVLSLPFVNASTDQLTIAAKRGNKNSSLDTIEVGALELYRLGPAAYIWTKYPRMLVKTFQKFFTTRWMLPLALIGVALLALARRVETLTIVCAVPVYFMITHAPLHLELRYILPINCFWAVLVATSLYFISITAWKLFSRLKRRLINS